MASFCLSFTTAGSGSKLLQFTSRPKCAKSLKGIPFLSRSALASAFPETVATRYTRLQTVQGHDPGLLMLQWQETKFLPFDTLTAHCINKLSDLRVEKCVSECSEVIIGRNEGNKWGSPPTSPHLHKCCRNFDFHLISIFYRFVATICSQRHPSSFLNGSIILVV